jgi:hypothetical protein
MRRSLQLGPMLLAAFSALCLAVAVICALRSFSAEVRFAEQTMGGLAKTVVSMPDPTGRNNHMVEVRFPGTPRMVGGRMTCLTKLAPGQYVRAKIQAGYSDTSLRFEMVNPP